ncbi:MAG: oligoendopeptidase F [Gammaproteobacteria bacterium]
MPSTPHHSLCAEDTHTCLSWILVAVACAAVAAGQIGATENLATESYFQADETASAQPSQNSATELTPHTWDLTDLYPTLTDWEEATESIGSQLEQLKSCQGKELKKRDFVTQCMQRFTATLENLFQAYTYASLAADIDLRNTEWQSRSQKVDLLYNQIQKIAANLEPALVENGNKLIKWSQSKHGPLAVYDQYFSDLLRRSKHILPPKQEQILAEASGPLQKFSETYSVLMNAEIPWPTLATPEGEELLLNSQGYSVGRQSFDREFRQLVFATFFGTLQKFGQTMGNLLAGQVRSHVVQARVRGYDSALQARLYRDNLPMEVYSNLVAAANDTLPSLHRYFKFRQQQLRLNNLTYYDIYPPLVPSLDRKFSIDQAQLLILEALKPLGQDYITRLKHGMSQRWVHLYPQQGKRSGAYMNGGAYRIHPYILMNFDEKFSGVSTLAHEWGHAIHSLLANESQPFTKADYSTFTAEMAAILPQTLLIDHLIRTASTPEEELYYLSEAMEDIRGTFYRQTMFAEFEQKIHQLAEQDQVLNSSVLAEVYGTLVRHYHGTEQHIVTVPEYINYEWAYIPHFYYNFYVFQYATSMAAAFYLADQITQNPEQGAETFSRILKAGGSDYPFELLQDAGVDMSDLDTFKAVGRRMNWLLERAEQALSKVEGNYFP